MTTTEEITVKEEFTAEEDFVLVEDDIKVEETCIQYCDEASNSSTDFTPNRPLPVIVEQKLLVCSMCKCAFERKFHVKFHNKSDLYKCNKCILHSRLSEVFNSNPLKTNWRRGQPPKSKWKKPIEDPTTRRVSPRTRIKPAVEENGDDDVIFVENRPGDKSDSVLIKKVMYLCLMCKKPFERNEPIKLRHESDLYKCNKCILHSRLSTVFNNNLPGKSNSSKQSG